MASGFRPFYLLGALYAPLLALGGVGAFFGTVDLAAGPHLLTGVLAAACAVVYSVRVAR